MKKLIQKNWGAIIFFGFFVVLAIEALIIYMEPVLNINGTNVDLTPAFIISILIIYSVFLFKSFAVVDRLEKKNARKMLKKF